MEFRVLGPLQVNAAGQSVPIGTARKRQVVLATLLSWAGQAVPIDTLIAAAWGDRPPASARRNLQQYVRQLRRALPEDLIRARGDAYAIDPGDDLDATRFRRLAAAGGASLDAGDPATAETTLRTALDLWRGPAFGEFLDCDPVRAEAERLELLRLEAYERWAEARLATGVTPSLAAELAELCRLHPYRESLRGHLMRALHRSGRQAEAVAVFRETRALLVEQLGVEPGEPLQQLHRQILAGDPAVSPSGTVTPSRSQPVPRQLPASPQVFIGRVPELAALDQAVDPSTVVISAIDGMAGVGKTALALHAAQRIADRYPDGQLFIDLHGYTQGAEPIGAGEALDRMLRALGVPGPQIPASLDERAGMYRTRLADRQILVVLDNAASEAQVAPLLPGAAGCLVLVTSRRRLAGLDHTYTLSLDTLPAADAVTLFSHTAGEDRLVGQPTDLLVELVELCGRLPLAIRVAAARLRSHPTWQLSHLVARLRDQQQRLVELAAGQRSVTAALDLSYQHLSPDLQRTYRLVGLHPGLDIDQYAAAALLGSTLPHAGRMLDQLLDAHLLVEPVAGRYRFHDLIRGHAARTATGDEPEPHRGVTLDRLLDYYLHTASLAMDAGYPYERERRPQVPPATTATPNLSDPAHALEWLDTELPNLLAAARCSAERGRPAHILRLSTTLHRHLYVRGRYHDAEVLHHQALTTARASGDQAGQLTALAGLGHLHRRQGRHERALRDYEQALQIARATGDGIGELDVLYGLGNVHGLQGRYEQAACHYEQALQIAHATGDGIGTLEASNGLGDVYAAQGRQGQAASYYEQALQIARTIGNPAGELTALIGLGYTMSLRGWYEQEASYHERALQIARTIGHRNGELTALTCLGRVRLRLGRREQAADYYQQLLHIAQPAGDRNFEFEARQGLGRLWQANGNPEVAIAHHGRALALAGELEQPIDRARAHDGLAHAYHALNQHEQARRHWQESFDILTGLGVDRTDDEQATVAAIRAHLTGLEQRQRPVRPR